VSHCERECEAAEVPEEQAEKWMAFTSTLAKVLDPQAFLGPTHFRAS